MVRRGVLLTGLVVVSAVVWASAPGSGSVLADEEEPAQEARQDEAVAVRLYLADGTVPAEDPTAAAWAEVPVSEFSLSPQVHWPDRLLDATVKSVKVRGLHDGESVAILLEYQDPTEDAADAAALEFMVGDKKAHFAHGQDMLLVEGGPVNIWYWTHASGKAVDMSAKGFGTLTPQTHQDVAATGVWQEGTWRVVFSRSLETSSKEQDVQILPGAWSNVAFAMWDGQMLESGEPKEQGSQKAVSSWWSLRAEPPADYAVVLYGFLGLVIAALFELAFVKKLKKGQGA